MSTTTVRLPDDLKKRLADVAEQAGMTSHALILQAISDRVEADEARNRLYDEADRRYALIAETGQSIPWSEMRRYLERRVAGETTEPTAPHPLSEYRRLRPKKAFQRGSTTSDRLMWLPVHKIGAEDLERKKGMTHAP